MKKIPFTSISRLLLLCFLTSCQKEATLFQQLSPADTQIHFSNRISESDTFNILSYEYIYNGGGIGVGDFNNDGLQDLFFTGNMVGNSLYLNQGNFKFKDITTTAGVAAINRWNSGVAVVDINNDGWMDIYVCATTHDPSPRRANSLFINNGLNRQQVLTFTEKAAEYGLADESHTTNAAFFDYDNDGDLDAYLLINQMDENAIPNRYRKKITDGSSRRTDKLLRNDFDEALGHPVFTDVSKEAGITIEGYGLGLNICDINGDGWKDIYVTNDYLTNDLFWVNSGQSVDSTKVTFSDQASTYFKHTSHSAMGNDVADLNNDGLADIIALDMLPEDNLRRKTMLPPNNYTSYLNNDRFGYQYQYIRNTLQLNQGLHPGSNAPVFSEIAMLAGVASTDWSWTPVVADFDLDGYRDIIVTNGFPHDVTDRDFMDYNSDKGAFLTNEQILEKIPSVKIKNYAFRNRLGEQNQPAAAIPVFENTTTAWGITHNSFSNGAVYADLDNDGDLDYVVNNINDSASVFKNLLVETSPDDAHWLKVRFKGSETNPQGLGAMVQVYYGKGQQQFYENTPYRGYLSSVEASGHFGLGIFDEVDSLVVTWQEGKRQVLTKLPSNQVLILSIENARLPARKNQQPNPMFQDVTAAVNVHYQHPESDYIDFNVQRLLPHKLSQYGPAIAVSDVNSDGLDDFYVGGSHFNKGQFFVQQPNGQFVQQDLLPGPEGDTKRNEEMGLLFFDADNDGDSDLYVVNGGYEFELTDACYQDQLFWNENGKFTLATNALPNLLSSGSCVKAADFDRDGDLDLFVGGRVHPFQYPLPVSSYLLQNDGNGHFTIANQTAAPALEKIGLVCDALWTDFDQDGWIDLMLAGEWMPLQFLRNHKGRFELHDSPALSALIGWWNSLASADFDLDGDIDYIAGNLGLNTLLRATDQQPVSIYAADFDVNNPNISDLHSELNSNLGLDALLSAYFPNANGKWQEFPFFGRTDMEKQLVLLKRLYLYHKTYGVTTMPDILKHFKNIEPLTLRANYFKTSYIENKGQGEFAIHELPMAAQLAPVFGMVSGDFNGDNLPDVLICGNDYGTETSIGRYDALNGLLLTGDGKGNFTPISMPESGICLPADAKSLVQLKAADGHRLLAAGQNKGLLKIFKEQAAPGKMIPLEPFDCAAVVHLKNGTAYRQELSYGSSFFSQSARQLWLPADAAHVEILDYRGNKKPDTVQ